MPFTIIIRRVALSGVAAGCALLATSLTNASDTGSACWPSRAGNENVLMATRFDTAAEVTDWVHPNSMADHVSWDVKSKASGKGSLRFDILKTDAADSGNWRRWLSDDKREFGEGDEFFVQFRQFVPAYYATHVFRNGGGWKQAIISRHSGDMGPGRKGSNQLNEIVLQNTGHRGIVQGYNRNLKGRYPPWQRSAATGCSRTDFLLQNGIGGEHLRGSCLSVRQKNGGLYSYYVNPPEGARPGYADPESMSFAYWPDEWVTYLVRVHIGTYGESNHTVQVWGARQGASDYTLIHDYDDRTLGRGPAHDTLWLLPYNSRRKPDPERNDTYTLYDEVIVSTSMIALPATGCEPAPS